MIDGNGGARALIVGLIHLVELVLACMGLVTPILAHLTTGPKAVVVVVVGTAMIAIVPPPLLLAPPLPLA
jgi:hypothetical protein